MLGRKYFSFKESDWGKVAYRIHDILCENDITPLFTKVMSKDKDNVYLMYSNEDDTTELANRLIETYPWKANGITPPDVCYAQKAIEIDVEMKVVSKCADIKPAEEPEPLHSNPGWNDVDWG